MTDIIGQSLGPYHILEQIGIGGMATVYKAFDTRLEREVAIKIIRKGAFPPEQLGRILKRFEREARALARLSHPNILKVLDYGEFDGSPYLVLEYLTSGSLKGKLGKPIPWREAARLLLPIANALQYAHEQGIVHRDVKPSNILITNTGQPMLSDFGIAKVLESEETVTLTGTGVGVGTPEYMAPEQWTGQAGQQSDVYSLGVVFYEMVTGHKPYVADTPAAILLKQATEPLPRPTRYVPDLPEPVERVLLKALAKNPADRYLGMEALSAALEALKTGKGQPVSSLENTATTADQTMDQDTVLQADSQVTFQNQTSIEHPGKTTFPPPLPQKSSAPGWLWPLVGIGGCLLVLLLTLALAFILGWIPLGGNQGSQATAPAPIQVNTNTMAPLPVYPTDTSSLVISTSSPRPLPTYTLFPTFTSVPQPRMFNFQSCLTPCDGTNNRDSFPEKTTKIYMQWQYENMPLNASYIRLSSFSGMEWARYECLWPEGSSGTEYRTFTEPAGIRSGNWTLSVVVNGMTLLSEDMLIEGTWDFWDPAGYFSSCDGKRP